MLITHYKKILYLRIHCMGVGEEGEGEMNGKNSMEVYTLPYVK